MMAYGNTKWMIPVWQKIWYSGRIATGRRQGKAGLPDLVSGRCHRADK